MEPVIVIATIRAKPGKEKATEDLVRSLLEPTHQESGCLFYTLHRHADKPGTFVFVEKWRSEADLVAHLQSPYVQAAAARQSDLLELLDIARFTPLPGGLAQKGTL